MYTAEGPENNSRDECHGYGQERGEESVEDVSDQLEHSMTANPDFVKAVCRGGLCDDVFKVNLWS